MSNFVVSARKYRPIRFDDVVGQQHVSQTLKNALQNDHLAHAFLFCGPRGVGKTTCARILAKVLNCQNITKDHEACNECDSCKALNQNASFNITELDAASNNSVEHIRALIEQVRFQPQQGKYKVFIIDEVHMLSQQAFNAFLKTLEEPPSYAIFILATTEKHKIIPTILSRCQIFDFRRIQVSDMVAHLQGICQQEKIEADKDALHIIAQKADGALRDALSIFDRIVSFAGKKISYEDVINNLNVLDYDYFFQIVDAMLVEDMPKVLTIFDDILKKGFESDIFINGLAEHIRNTLVCKDAQTLSLLEVSDSLKKRYETQAAIAPASFLLTALNLCNDCDVNYKMARNKRLHVEMAIIKMCYINRAVNLSQQAKTPEAVIEKKTPDQSVTAKQITPAVTNTKAAPTPKKVEEPKEKISKPPAEKTPLAKTTTTSGNGLASSMIEGTSLKMPKLVSLDQLEEEINNEQETEKDDPSLLTEENLQKSWSDYTATISSPSVKAVLSKVELKIVENRVVAIVGSPMAKGMIQEELDLMPHIRKELKTSRLALEIQIDPSKAAISDRPKPKKLLTVKEKYEKMRDENPLIDDIRKRFDLQIDPD